MKEDYEIGEKKQAAADVLFHYSKFVMACMGNQVRPCDLRLHLMKDFGRSTKHIIDEICEDVLINHATLFLFEFCYKNENISQLNYSNVIIGHVVSQEISGMPTSLKRRTSQIVAASPVAMGESSSSGHQDFDKADSFQSP